MKKFLVGFFLFSLLLYIIALFMPNDSATNSTDPTDVANTDSLSTALEGPTTEWVYDEYEDKMDNTKTKVASVISDNAIELKWPYGENRFKFNVRKNKSGTDIYITCDKCQFLTGYSNDKTYRLKVDDQSPFKVYATGASSGASDVAFLGSEATIIKKLKGSNKLIVEAEFYDDGLRTIEFITYGFEW